jgi:hypothetical protein
VEHLADLGAVRAQLGAARLDVVDRQQEPVDRAGLCGGDALAEDHRGGRPGRGHLHHAEATVSGIGVQAPAQPLVEALGPVDVGDGKDHDLEAHRDVADRDLGGIGVTAP